MLHLIEISSMMHRAYHVAPPLVRPSDERPIGAVYVLAQMVHALLKKMGDCTHRVAVFDAGRSGRDKIDASYKANRGTISADLSIQIPMARNVCKAFSIATCDVKGYEADDVIATLTRQAEEAGKQVRIASNDKDFLQLVSSQTEMYDTQKNTLVGPIQVQCQWGIEPSQFVDMQALSGDTADNVPGVQGIGPKIAAELLKEYGTLEAVLKAAPEIKQQARRVSLLAHANQALKCRELVRLIDNVPETPSFEDFPARSADEDGLRKLCEYLESKTLPGKLGLEN